MEARGAGDGSDGKRKATDPAIADETVDEGIINPRVRFKTMNGGVRPKFSKFCRGLARVGSHIEDRRRATAQQIEGIGE